MTKSHSILILDADSSSQANLLQFLAELGYQTLATSDMGKAQNCLTENKADLLIVDLNIGESTCVNFLHTVHNQRPRLPIIIIASHSQAGAATKILRTGIYDYLIKPIDYERLKGGLWKALEYPVQSPSHQLAARMAIVNEIWQKLTPLLDTKAITKRLEAEIAWLVSFDRLTIYLLDRESGRLIMSASSGFTEEQIKHAQATAMERHPGWVVNNRQPLFVPDTRHDPRMVYTSSLYRSASAIHVPLLYENQVLGVLGVGSDKTYAFDPTDLSVLESLAAQVSITLENARLNQEMQRRIQALDTLQTISAAASTSLQPKQVIQMATQALLRLSDVSLARILVHAPNTNLFRVEATATRRPDGLADIPADLANISETSPLEKSKKSWIDQVILTKKPLFISADRLETGLSLALLPMIVHEDVLGVLLVATTATHLTISDRTLLASVVDRIAAALNNAYLHQAERRRTRELTLLVKAMQSLSSTLDLHKSLQHLVNTLGQHTDAPLVLLSLYDPQDDYLTVQASYKGPRLEMNVPIGTRMQVSASPKLTRVLETHTPLFITNPGVEKNNGLHHEPCLDFAHAAGASALLITPLLRGEEFIGVLGLWLQRPSSDPPFELMRLVDSVAHYAVMTIDNARFYAAMQTERARTESLYKIERQLVARLDPDELVPLVLEITQQQTSAKWGSLILFDASCRANYYRLTRKGLKVKEAEQVIRAVMENGAAGWAVENKESCLITDTSQDPRWLRIPQDDTVSTSGSALIVPMIRGDQVVGVLTLAHPDAGHFTSGHQIWLETLANRAAVAIENAQLYKRVRSEQQQLNTILHSTADAVIVVDQQANLILANPAAERLFGHKLDETFGQNLYRLAAGDNIDPKQFFRQDSLAPYTFDVQVGQRTMRGHTAPIKEPDDRVKGWVTVLRDITDLKELDRLKSQMIRMASHDLRNPLHITLNYLLLLAEEIKQPTDVQKEMLSGMQRNLLRMEDLIRDILDLERIETGTGRRVEPLNWKTLVQDVVDESSEMAMYKEHIITLDIPADLPTVFGDQVQLRQTISNLLNNAIKYTPAGGQITIHSRHTDKELCIEIKDNGVGIPADRLPRLFQQFYRAKQPGTEKIAGTGLGLSLVKAVIEGHRGRVWVHSKENQGSTFGFALPLNTNGLS